MVDDVARRRTRSSSYNSSRRPESDDGSGAMDSAALVGLIPSEKKSATAFHESGRLSNTRAIGSGNIALRTVTQHKMSTTRTVNQSSNRRVHDCFLIFVASALASADPDKTTFPFGFHAMAVTKIMCARFTGLMSVNFWASITLTSPSELPTATSVPWAFTENPEMGSLLKTRALLMTLRISCAPAPDAASSTWC